MRLIDRMIEGLKIFQKYNDADVECQHDCCHATSKQLSKEDRQHLLDLDWDVAGEWNPHDPHAEPAYWIIYT